MSTAPPESGQSDPCRVHINLAAAARTITRCGRHRRRLTAAVTAERSVSAREVA